MPGSGGLDSPQPPASGLLPEEKREDVHWTTLDEDELEDAYWASVGHDLALDDKDPATQQPTHAWLREHGYRQLPYALREYHDTTFSAFWSGLSGTRPPGEDGRDWASRHDRTRELLDSFIDSREERTDLAQSTIDTHQQRLNRYVQAYIAAGGSEDLISPITRDSDTPAYEATDAAFAAYDRLNNQLAGPTMNRIHETVTEWYQHLRRRKVTAVVPTAGFDDEYRWSTSSDDEPIHLEAEHVRALAEAAENPREDVLVRALCAWGLRPGEVAALHVRNIVEDPADDDIPILKFNERKNGPGEVSILFGFEELEERLDELGGRDGWEESGYLFPSPDANCEHVTTETIRRWFEDLCERADIDNVRGESPLPKMGRRYWYDTYTSALIAVTEGLDTVAAEQGSADPKTVMTNYLDDEQNRRVLREFMRNQLEEAFN